MPDFSLIIDSFVAFVLLSVAVSGTLYALERHRSHDPSLDNIHKAHVVLRWMAMIGFLWAFCWMSNIPVWLVLLAWGVTCFIPVSPTGTMGFGIIGIATQLALGVPNLHDLFLRADRDPEIGGDKIESDLIGESGVVEVSLRPNGRASINHQSYPATSEDGSFIEAGIPIIVQRLEHNRLIVCPASQIDATESQPTNQP